MRRGYTTPLSSQSPQRLIPRPALATGNNVLDSENELLVGTRDYAGFRKLDKLLDALPEVPIDDVVWREAARLGSDLQRHGITVPLPDLLIAEAAIQAEIELWHTDDHFEEITKLVPLGAKNLLRAD